MDREKVIKAWECCNPFNRKCKECPYEKDCYHDGISRHMVADAIALLKEQKEERKRMISWLGKFCRHIDNGDAWLTDEENIAFFKEKMKQQFGWNTD